MHSEREMSPLAQTRMAEMLPQLVGAVRWRRRRRRALQVGAVAAALWLAFTLWPDRGDPVRQIVPGPPSRTSICEVVRDVPDVLAKYRYQPVARAEWFIGDEELQQFLSEGERPSGIVRVGSRVTVVRSAIDPFPADQVE